MRTCPKCMTENLDTAKFCKQCAAPLQQSGGKTCPSGRHTMDPTWTECVYCKQENAAPAPSAPPPAVPPVRTPTVFECQAPPPPPRKDTEVEDIPGRPAPPRPPRPVSAPLNPPQRVGGQQPPQPKGRDATVYRPIPGGGSTTPPVTQNRKIVGILVTYSWAPEGKIFPVLEGRNYIGRDPECEISIPEDQTMSARNSHITYRTGFVVGDMVSMTGTDLNGAPIEEQFHSLANYSTIRAGSTYFTFIVVQPPAAAAPEEPPQNN
ncbi:MAG TPA: zinc ribbon domain-containing protein [Terriglobales bacterium]|nr:zinc ribbon domain-containing protein [Terriglobales bacterium]